VSIIHQALSTRLYKYEFKGYDPIFSDKQGSKTLVEKGEIGEKVPTKLP
jgi:hypothetical protein